MPRDPTTGRGVLVVYAGHRLSSVIGPAIALLLCAAALASCARDKDPAAGLGKLEVSLASYSQKSLGALAQRLAAALGNDLGGIDLAQVEILPRDRRTFDAEAGRSSLHDTAAPGGEGDPWWR